MAMFMKIKHSLNATICLSKCHCAGCMSNVAFRLTHDANGVYVCVFLWHSKRCSSSLCISRTGTFKYICYITLHFIATWTVFEAVKEPFWFWQTSFRQTMIFSCFEWHFVGIWPIFSDVCYSCWSLWTGRRSDGGWWTVRPDDDDGAAMRWQQLDTFGISSRACA